MDQYTLLSEQIAEMRKERIIQTDVTIKFQLKHHIAKAQAELDEIEAALEAMEDE